MDRVGGLGSSREAGVSLVAQQALDCVLLAVHGGKVQGRVLLPVDCQRVAAQVDHPLYGGVLVLHGGIHERSVASDRVTHVLQGVGAKLRVAAFL